MTITKLVELLNSVGIPVFHGMADEEDYDAYIVWTLSPKGAFYASGKMKARFMRLWINLFDTNELSTYDKSICSIFGVQDACAFNPDIIISDYGSGYTQYVYSVQFVLEGDLDG